MPGSPWPAVTSPRPLGRSSCGCGASGRAGPHECIRPTRPFPLMEVNPLLPLAQVRDHGQVADLGGQVDEGFESTVEGEPGGRP